MARNDTPRSERWRWLAHTYWYVPRANLLALASSPARKTPVPVSDQTVYYISDYAGGYFWGTTAVSYTRRAGRRRLVKFRACSSSARSRPRGTCI
ncbi:MAG TPA: hypothetical protein VGP52_06495 [Stellaceae bacterium]|nr:hypothetical protein [Stellaceae bacterium]